MAQFDAKVATVNSKLLYFVVRSIQANLVCEIPSSFERSSLSNFRTKGPFLSILTVENFRTRPCFVR